MDSRSSSPQLVLVLSLLFLLPFSVNPSPRPRWAYPRSPIRFAEDLIRDLNLLPGIQENEGEWKGDDPSGPRLVEKRLSLEILGESGSEIPIEQLGHHAGYYRLEHTHAAKMFYFFFESRHKSSDPVVIWLTGGPGCSSELALFYENGPFKIADNMSLIWNDYGWDKASNLIFVDQPTGTGFSYSEDLRDLRYNEKGVSNDLYDFLQAFFKEHQNYLENDFYITGESYAGHYIPAAAERVHMGNKEKQGLQLNLKGFAIGNGLTDPKIQYGAYADYALDMGIIGESAYKSISKIYPFCELGVKLCGPSGVITCLASYFVCNSIFTSIMVLAGDINYYDIRKKCVGDLCYDFSNMEKFLNQKSVRDALGVGDRKFRSCNPVVYEAMLTDWMKNLEVGIPALIDDGIKVLVYAGEYDLICNWLDLSSALRKISAWLNPIFSEYCCMLLPSHAHKNKEAKKCSNNGLMLGRFSSNYKTVKTFNLYHPLVEVGNFRWVNSMEWSGHQIFADAPMLPFVVDGKEAGLLKTHGPLSFLKVYDAGHMVPMDQPGAALEMLKRWMQGSLSYEGLNIRHVVKNVRISSRY